MYQNIQNILIQKIGNIKTITKEQHNFSYRYSIFKEKKAVIIGAKFRFKYGNKEEIEKRMKENFISRKTKQPIEYPSAGSTFKRGKDFITAQLIDECGLKGLCVGGAQVSEKHAGFVINKGGATAADVIELMEIIKQKIYNKYKKEIELEIEIVG